MHNTHSNDNYFIHKDTRITYVFMMLIEQWNKKTVNAYQLRVATNQKDMAPLLTKHCQHGKDDWETEVIEEGNMEQE